MPPLMVLMDVVGANVTLNNLPEQPVKMGVFFISSGPSSSKKAQFEFNTSTNGSRCIVDLDQLLHMMKIITLIDL